jgi:hypothetical protein
VGGIGVGAAIFDPLDPPLEDEGRIVQVLQQLLV